MRPESADGRGHFETCAQQRCHHGIDLMMVIINTKLSQSPALNRLEDKAIE